MRLDLEPLSLAGCQSASGPSREPPDVHIGTYLGKLLGSQILDGICGTRHNREVWSKGVIETESAGCVGRNMAEYFEDPIVQLVIWLAVFSALVAVAAYIIMRLRTEAVQNEPVASELLSKFRELHVEGDLSEEEFRTIKTTLAEQLQEELKDNEGKG